MSERKINTKYEDDTIIKTVSTLLLILPVFIAIIIVNRLIVKDYPVTVVLGITILINFYFRNQLEKGRQRERATLFLSIFFTVVIAVITTVGNGIHDIGVIAFPVALGFSSIILRQKELIVTFIITLLSLAWLVFGEMYGLFSPQPMTIGTNGDFLITSTIVTLGGVITYMLTRNLRNSLLTAQEEYKARKMAAKELEKELIEKSQLIGEVHAKVIKSLFYIGKLSSQNNHSIYRKIMCIEVAHSLLNRDKAYEQIDLQDYSLLLIDRYKKHYEESEGWETSVVSSPIPIDDCISFGICFLEMIHQARNPKDGKLKLSIDLEGRLILVTIMSNYLKKYPESDPSKLLMETMAKQLKGSLVIQKRGNEVIQSLQFENRNQHG